jgi:hypothetical protein
MEGWQAEKITERMPVTSITSIIQSLPIHRDAFKLVALKCLATCP